MKKIEIYLSTQRNKTNQSLDLINIYEKINLWEWKSLQLSVAKWKPSEVLTKFLKWNLTGTAAQADTDALHGD